MAKRVIRKKVELEEVRELKGDMKPIKYICEDNDINYCNFYYLIITGEIKAYKFAGAVTVAYESESVGIYNSKKHYKKN